MNTSNEGTGSDTAVTRLPLWLRISGGVVFVGSAILEGRLIWEQTVWTWERGPQMVGFSLAHGLGVFLFLFPILLVLWLAVAVVLTVRSLIRKDQITTQRWVGLGLVVLLFVFMGLPDGFWQRVFIGRMADSPRAGDLLLYAAYRGDLGTVRAFVSHGVAVDATDHAYWRTAMHGAAAKGDLSILRYLVSKRANINALDRSGDSPLELAASANRAEAVKFLTESGAKRIRGDEAQRKKAIDDQVQESIEELDRAEAADKKLQEDIKRATQDEEIQRNGHKDNTQ
jgi:hypothetical protein